MEIFRPVINWKQMKDVETNYWVQRAIRTFSDLTANIVCVGGGGIELWYVAFYGLGIYFIAGELKGLLITLS